MRKTKIISTIAAAVMIFLLIAPVVVDLNTANWLVVSATVQNVNLNTTYTGSLSLSNSSNQYYFTLSNAGDIVISVSTSGSITTNSWTARIFSSSSGNLLYSNEFGASGSVSSNRRHADLPKINLSAGTYYVDVANFNSNIISYSEYTINIKYTATSSTSSSSSKTINLNSAVNDTLSASNLSRQYHFTLSTPGSVVITLSTPSTHSTNSWKARLFSSGDKSNEVIYSVDFGASGIAVANQKSIDTDKFRLPAGAYFIDISNVSSTVVSYEQYTINVKYTAESGSDYEKEYNETMETATALNPGGEITGNLNTSKDCDMFKINLTSTGSLQLKFTTPSAIDLNAWVVFLYNSSGETLQFSQVGFSGNVVGAQRINVLEKVRLPIGTYYACVMSRSESTWNNTDYRLAAQFSPETNSSYEKEFNNTTSTANKIQLNAPVNGNMSNKDDIDYFTFDVSQESEIRINFQSPDNIVQNFWTIFLQNEKGGLSTFYAGQSGTLLNGMRSITTDNIKLAEGKYYVAVYPLNKNLYSNDDYILTALSDSAPTPSSPIEDIQVNPEDIPTKNSNVNTNLKGSIKNHTDVNIYDFSVTHHGSVYINFQYPSEITTNSWIAKIYDKNNNLLSETSLGANGQGSSATKSEFTSLIRVPAGYYTLEVSPVNSYNYSSKQYDFSIVYKDESALDEKYEIENNNTTVQATTIETGTEYTGNISNYRDIDYFKFELVEGGSVNLSFFTSDTVKRKDWVIRLYNSNLEMQYEYEFGAEGQEITASETSPKFKEEETSKIRVGKGVYYVYVGPYNNVNWSDSDYKLKVTYTEESVYKFERENNDSILTANSLNLNEYKTGNIENKTDNDFYKVTLSEADRCQIKFRTDGSVSEGYWFVKVYDPKGTLLKTFRFGNVGAIATDGTRSVKTDYIDFESGDYYLCVTPFSDQSYSTKDYSLKLLDKVGQKIETLQYPGSSKPSSWAVEEVELAYGEDLVPYEFMKDFTTAATREDFCLLIANFLTVYEQKSINEILEYNNVSIDMDAFTDTTEEAIFAINALGIVNGKGNQKFAPKDSITRQEAAAILYRIGVLCGINKNSESVTFKDEDKIDTWAKDAVRFVSGCIDKKGDRVMNGLANGNFDPLSKFTREQVYLTLLRLYRVNR